MLTDYHTHLRPDDPAATAEHYFTEANVLRYLEAADNEGIAELGFSEHVHRFRQALDVWQHPFWQENAVDDLGAYVEFVVEMKEKGLPVKLGIELDYLPGREQFLDELLGNHPWDYVIGSVHFIADRAVDMEAYDAWRNSSADQVWGEYFTTLGQAAESGLFDILAHPDLVKVWGAGRPSPDADLRDYYELAIGQIAAADVAIELSTAGLRKPVGELYPAEPLLQLFVDAGKPIALSSDAHLPDQIGFAYEQAIACLENLGVQEICVFEQRQRTMETIG
jgi:histidinol-phosphatase (PHP family)